jgi:hypothetical protein
MAKPSDPHQLPYPSNNSAGRNNRDSAPKTSFSKIAALWKPANAALEKVCASVSRFAQRLIDRETGEAYSADKLATYLAGKGIYPLVYGTPTNGAAAIAEYWAIAGSLTSNGSAAVSFSGLHFKAAGTLNGKTYYTPTGLPLTGSGTEQIIFYSGTYWVIEVHSAGSTTSAWHAAAGSQATPNWQLGRALRFHLRPACRSLPTIQRWPLYLPQVVFSWLTLPTFM